MDLTDWALPQLSRLLPLDEESLRQVITYAKTLSSDAAADHLGNLLGDSPQATEFISSFNSRRRPKAATSSGSQSRQNAGGNSSNAPSSPMPKPGPRKKRQPLNKLPPPRQPESYGNISSGYRKNQGEDYMAARAKPSREKQHGLFQLQDEPDAKQGLQAASSTSSRNPSPRNSATKLPPSAAGPLISDTLSAPTSRTSFPGPKPKTKVHLTGGTPMHGASTTLEDFDSAIRALELQTNPSLSSSSSRRKCTCMATRHALLAAAPNCLACGKIVCVKEGLGPCTFCGAPLIAPEELQAMIRSLRDERGRERMAANNAAQRRADQAGPSAPGSRAGTPKPFGVAPPPPALSSSSAPGSAPASDAEDGGAGGLARARAHRDRLLSFQAQNARRTRVHDQAADFETPSAGLSMWAGPAERAAQLRRQQRALREQEWAARPEWEKRRVVASIDLAGGKVVRRMAEVERPEEPEGESEGEGGGVEVGDGGESTGGGGGGGAFSRNPLMGKMIRPVAKVSDTGGELRERQQTWRRVQDDNDDNEQWILDGGAYGGKIGDEKLVAEEPACG
ncbi:hypothetical protein BDY21DRAFT_302092 [Lineolata rhizophorae]|uniref:TRIP4/RQT4 C2HC5-type zinc finger domain-containing protein n=1 Tax=Lineolata rhizophorae TaxID=578093 RepID=A0A6A6P261_9PEZI|nr:hypothetical protein BDY21DRAFT_302092 [Lineolata rhizophorae]